jgi:hypothetical protein
LWLILTLETSDALTEQIARLQNLANRVPQAHRQIYHGNHEGNDHTITRRTFQIQKRIVKNVLVDIGTNILDGEHKQKSFFKVESK